MSNIINPDPDTDPDTEIAEAFRLYAPYRGLSADDLGREFQHKDSSYRIVGFNPSNTRYPVICDSLDVPGRRYKFPTWLVRDRLIGRYPLPPIGWTGCATRRVVGAP